MIVVHATMVTKEGQRDNLIEPGKAVVEATRQESGNISYELFFSAIDENKAMVVEEWENMESVQAHMQTAHFAAYREAIAPFLAGGGKPAVFEATEL